MELNLLRRDCAACKSNFPARRPPPNDFLISVIPALNFFHIQKWCYVIISIFHFQDCILLNNMSEQQKANADHHANQMNSNSGTHQDRMDHHANQNNPNNSAFAAAADNRANQMNPNNPAYQSSRSSGDGKDGQK
jgi:hypothetical protein